MAVIYHKIWRDLLGNKTRTLLVVLSIAVGLFALGLVISLSKLMTARMTEEWEAARPAHLALYLRGYVDDEPLSSLERVPGVAEIEPLTYTDGRWKRAGESEWRNCSLTVRQDYTRQRLDTVQLWDGPWPDEQPRNTLSVERHSARFFNLPPGSWIVLQIGQVERTLQIGGVIRDIKIFPPQFGGDAGFFASREIFHDLTGFDGYSYLLVRLPQFDQVEAHQVAVRLEERLKKIDMSAGTPDIQDPHKHFIQEQMDQVLFIMGVLGVLSLALSAFLVVNTVNAVLAQQVPQIGAMKAVGATWEQVAGAYLALVVVYGVVAVAIAIPLAALAAFALASLLLSLMNIELASFHLVPQAALVQLTVGLLVPALAAMWPVLSGTRITVHQAISSYGLEGAFGRGALDRLVSQVRGLPRPLALSLRNTFRRKGRLALTLVTLTIAGVMFMAVMSIGLTLTNTIDRLFDSFGYDLEIGFESTPRYKWAEAVARSVPGVTASEMWTGRSGTLDLGERQPDVYVRAIPPASTMYQPTLTSGRWLHPDDGNAMVVNQKLALEEGLQVGDWVTLDLDDKGESEWEIVGAVLDISNNQRSVFVPRETFGRTVRMIGRGGWILVKTERHDPAYQAEMEQRLRAAFEANAARVGWSSTDYTERQMSHNRFNILTYLLLAMSVLAGCVGSFGLMGTMSINVLERSREIGVMRAIGASPGQVMGIFVVEGVVLGLLSAAMAVPLSYPAARAFSNALGELMFKFPLSFRYSTAGLYIWLGVVVILSALGSLWPAWRAARLSVSQTLAYE